MDTNLNGAGIEEIRNQVAIELAILDEEITRTTGYLTAITLQRDQLRAARYLMTLDDPLDVVQVPPDCIGCHTPTFETAGEGEPLCDDGAKHIEAADHDDFGNTDLPAQPCDCGTPTFLLGPAGTPRCPGCMTAADAHETRRMLDEVVTAIDEAPASETDQELHPSAGEGAGLQQSSDADASTFGGQPGAAPDTQPSWADVAEVWISAHRAGLPTVPVLAERFGRPQTTVQNWPTKLRKYGLIPPAGVDLDDWLARKTAAPQPSPAADSAGIAVGDVGYACETDGCTFRAPEGIDGRSRMRTHAREAHGRKATAFELTAGVIE